MYTIHIIIIIIITIVIMYTISSIVIAHTIRMLVSVIRNVGRDSAAHRDGHPRGRCPREHGVRPKNHTTTATTTTTTTITNTTTTTTATTTTNNNDNNNDNNYSPHQHGGRPTGRSSELRLRLALSLFSLSSL